MGFGGRSGLAVKCKGVQPGFESVKREGAEEALFRGGAVGHDHPVAEPITEFRPELEHDGSVGNVVVADAVNPAGGPGYGSFGLEERREKVSGFDDAARAHDGDADLDRDVGVSAQHPRALEVDGSEGRSRIRMVLVRTGGYSRRRASVAFQSRQASVMETP